ncbi:MAG: glutamyl-tRNA reductase [Crocinitomicaceae bacterium]|nr:glutamyl-tRNA reductase [Crocinitomicaceae bacterium]
MNDLRIIALTHKELPLDSIGKFHVAPSERAVLLQSLKLQFGMSEIMLLSTCNRVEIIFCLPHYVCPGVTSQILSAFAPHLSSDFIHQTATCSERYNGPEAIQHLLRVASSLESVVIGEREIITQLRKAYEECEEQGLTGDNLRLVIKQCVKTAKEIFSHTDLAKRPVSVVSLAWQQFRDYGLKKEARILLIGAGQVIRNFSKFLIENDYSNITVANRTLAHAEEIAGSFGGKSMTMEDLPHFSGGFDALISCTAADTSIINKEIYLQLLSGENAQKLVIDLALPADIAEEVTKEFPMIYIGMNKIRELASANMSFREKALSDCDPIIESGVRKFERLYNERKVERAMRSIPDAIREIRNTALGSVFEKDLENLDENSREILNKILHYMEKKYISVPMKMAREVLLDSVSKNSKN